MSSPDVEALLAEIEASDSRATYEVLADALVQLGDPRGELMVAQLALDEAPRRSDDPVATWPRSLAHRTAEDAAREERPPTLTREAGRELRLRAAALQEARAAELATGLEDRSIELAYRYGYLDRVTVSWPFAPTLAKIFASPEARLLRIVQLDPHSHYNHADLARLDRDMGALGAVVPSALRTLVLGRLSWWHSGYTYISGVDNEAIDLAGVIGAFPTVPELWIDLHSQKIVGWCTIVSEHLRHFTYVTPCVRRDELASIAEARVPNLASLVVWAGASHYVNRKYDMNEETPIYMTVEEADFEPLLGMLDGCTELRMLGICHYVGDVAALVAAIAAHPCGARLETLDLSFASEIDAGALAEQLDRLAALRTVRLDGIEIDPDSQRVIEGSVRSMEGGVAVDGTPYRYVIYQE